MKVRTFGLCVLSTLVFQLVGLRSVLADDWMARVGDDVYVNQLSIPGAHDAGTGHGFQGVLGTLGGNTYARTQDKTITEQWNSGVRAFDLRPCVNGNSLQINHGILQTSLTLSTALSTLCNLLDQHPTEMAIVLIRHETEGDSNSSNWNSLMTTLLDQEPVKSYAITFTPSMKMRDARGKLLILSRDEYASTPVGGFITGWSHNSAFSSQTSGIVRGSSSQAPCYIQDFYELTADGAKETKRKSIITLLRYTAEQNEDMSLWAINHTSGYSKTAELFGNTLATSEGNRDNAATQNAAVISWLTDHSGPTGIVMMDFVGVDRSDNYDVMGLSLTNALIENNFRQSDYVRAMGSIQNGQHYRIFTERDGLKYFLTSDGYLTREGAQSGSFGFTKVLGEEYGCGFKLMDLCFTNPDLNNGEVVLTPGHIRTNTMPTPRDTWEAQVFLKNEDGKYAIRATNAESGTSGWALAGNTYWAAIPNADGLEAIYSFSRSYIWQLMPVLLGDINIDGSITIADVTALVNIILGKETGGYGEADINGDGSVTIADVTALVNIILGK